MKLFLYPHANIHTHDKIPAFVNTVPFSQEGIKKHCTLVDDPKEAEYFYMGQISDGNMDDPTNLMTEESFTYLQEYPKTHILDLEGDWCADPNHTACGYGRMIAPEWVLKNIKSCAPTKYAHWVDPIMARPHVSELLIFLSKNPEADIEFPEEASYGFRGMSGPIPTRARLAKILQASDIPNEIILNPGWGGRKGLDSPAVTAYIDSMYQHMLSLCPESTCSATIRFYETCFFARVPVIVGEQMILEEHDYDTSFLFKVNAECTDEQMLDNLRKIAETPLPELIDRGKAARQYFLDVVCKYFEDPTAYFMDWMKRKNL